MDWTYKHFHDERSVPQPRGQAVNAARDFVSDRLQWATTETPDGFDARGHMVGRTVIAHFRFEPAAGEGTKIRVELLAERTGSFGMPGYMLFEPLGYFQRHIRMWLVAIGDRLDGKPDAAMAEAVSHPRRDRLLGYLFVAVSLIIGAYLVYIVILLLIGLMTGDLYLSGRYGAGGTTVHGVWARIIAGSILALIAFFIFLGRRQIRKRRRPTILGP